MFGRVVGASAVCLLFAGSLAGGETLVKDVAEFDAAVKAALPGDAIVLADGEWRDAKLVVRAGGTRELPLTVRAQTPGRVVFVGRSTLRIGGEYVVVKDMHWKDVEADGEVIAFRIDSQNLARHCQLTECAITGDTPTKGDRKWVSLYGEGHYVTNCRFEGKQSAGTLLVVWLGEDDLAGGHHIEHNFFGPRQRLGKNGGEIIRVGDSKTSMRRAITFVMSNYFYRCDGEAEIISNKSCQNFYQKNVFVGCSGALTLRHGNRCRVIRNEFYGDGRKGTGGVRIIGEGHKVAGNLFHSLEGNGTRAAVSLMNGIQDSPLNGYFAANNAEIAGNVLVDCKQNFAVGLADDDRKDQLLPPLDAVFRENIVATVDQPVFTLYGLFPGARHEANLYHGDLGIETGTGWRTVDAMPKFDPKTQTLTVIKEAVRFAVKVVDRPAAGSASFNPLESVGPAWMRPGEEYLPAVLKGEGEKPAK
jgi:poly(beta-D-mannuronate) lyase